MGVKEGECGGGVGVVYICAGLMHVRHGSDVWFRSVWPDHEATVVGPNHIGGAVWCVCWSMMSHVWHVFDVWHRSDIWSDHGMGPLWSVCVEVWCLTWVWCPTQVWCLTWPWGHCHWTQHWMISVDIWCLTWVCDAGLTSGLTMGPLWSVCVDVWCHTLSIAFQHLPPNSARFGYTTEGAFFISTQLSTDAVSTLWTVWVLITLWKQLSAQARM